MAEVEIPKSAEQKREEQHSANHAATGGDGYDSGDSESDDDDDSDDSSSPKIKAPYSTSSRTSYLQIGE